MAKRTYTVSHYLLERLKELGVDHIFGVPGDFVLGFFHAIEESGVKCICTCNEINAAYAADGYARMRGMGAVTTTYVVGELSAINGIAGAYAERVPVVKIAGCPSTRHFEAGTLLHHSLGDYKIPLKMYEHVTVASTLLEDAEKAPAEIDRVLSECYYHKLPCYIAIPADIAMAACEKPSQKLEVPSRPKSNPTALQEAVEEAAKMLNGAKKPVVVVDAEISRFGMVKEVQAFIEKLGYPFAAMMLGKSMIDEHHPQFIGLYSGDRSREYVKKRVEEADCILLLGTVLTDFNTGGFTAKLDAGKSIFANIEQLKIRHHFYKEVNFREFLGALEGKLTKRDPNTLDVKQATDACPHRSTMAYQMQKGAKLTLNRVFDRISHFLDEHSVLMVETGSSMFAGAEVLQPKGCKFMSQTFFGSIGYTVGATLGVSIAEPKRRVCLFVGDGSFQVTCQDVSTMIRYHTNPVILLINNDGYLIERVISDGPFNDIQPWKYQQITELFGGRAGTKVHTEDELETALQNAKAHPHEVVFIEVMIDRWDSPASMTKARAAMARDNYLVDINKGE